MEEVITNPAELADLNLNLGGTPSPESPARDRETLGWENPDESMTFEDVTSEIAGLPETPEVKPPVVAEPAAPVKTALTPEEQSEKDKFYHQESKRVAELEARIAELAARPVAPAQPAGDPIAERLSGQAAELRTKVESGDLDQTTAEYLWKTAYTAEARVYELEQRFNQVQGNISIRTGSEHVIILKNSLAELGVAEGSVEEREALTLLKRDWGIDLSKPETLVRYDDPAQLKTVAQYVSSVANRSAATQKGAPPTPAPNLMIPGPREDAKPTTAERQKFKSCAEVTAAHLSGKLR
jgi:hypothetical protein